MKVGFHVEGWDHLVLKALFAKVLDFPEEDIEVDWIDLHTRAAGRGYRFVFKLLPGALARFYEINECALAIVGIDNDGNCDIRAKGLIEDPFKPRHWNHGDNSHPLCRWCQISEIVNVERHKLKSMPEYPADQWPIIIAVPVEQIESWLLIMQSLISNTENHLQAENELRTDQKYQFYGKPKSGEKDIRRKAIPLIKGLSNNQINLLKQHSKSFANFADQIDQAREIILRPN